MKAEKDRLVETAIKAIDNLEGLFESFVEEHKKHCATCPFSGNKDLCARIGALSLFSAVIAGALRRVFSHFTKEELEEADQVLWAIFAKLFYGSFALSLGGLLVVAHGESMRPQIEDGDILVLVPVLPREVRVGDIVAYPKSLDEVFFSWVERKPRAPFLVHRVVRMDDEHIITKGDAASKEDKPIGKRLLWKVIKIIKKGTPLWKQLYSDAIDRMRVLVFIKPREA